MFFFVFSLFFLTRFLPKNPRTVLRNVTEMTLALKRPVVDNVVPYYSFAAVGNCRTPNVPAWAVVTLAFVDAECAWQLRDNWNVDMPPIIWRATERSNTSTAGSSTVRGFFSVDSPALLRLELLQRLVASLALERAVLVTNDEEVCQESRAEVPITRWPHGPVVCVENSPLTASDLQRVKDMRSPVIVIDL